MHFFKFKKFTLSIIKYSLKEYSWLLFLLFAFISYPNSALAENTSSILAQQTIEKETITGAFGIKFGEDIRPYLEGNYSGNTIEIDGFNFRFLNIKPPMNLKKILPPSITSAQVEGISDDNNRVIVLSLDVTAPLSSCNNNADILKELYRGKYKTIYSKGAREIYGDDEGNSVSIVSCNNVGSFTIQYESHLKREYIDRLKINQQKGDEKLKNIYKNIL